MEKPDVLEVCVWSMVEIRIDRNRLHDGPKATKLDECHDNKETFFIFSDKYM